MHHLDTCIVIAYLNGNRTVADRLKFHFPDIAISSVVLGELLYGARASARCEENLKNLEKFLLLVNVSHYDRESAEMYSKIRLSLKQEARHARKNVTEQIAQLLGVEFPPLLDPSEIIKPLSDSGKALPDVYKLLLGN